MLERITDENGKIEPYPCELVDPEIFFPLKGETGKIDEAARLCAKCAVRATCLDEALDKQIDFGIWGGVTEEGRRKLRKQNGVQRRHVA